MNLENLKKQLKIDEGCCLEVYLDSEGLPTVGIGHLLTKNDPELLQWQVGKKANPKFSLKITEETCDRLFEKDVKIACDSCKKLLPDFDKLPETVKQILVNMMFNLGLPRLSNFKKFLKAIETKDWKQASEEMIDSKWYKQVGLRGNRLALRMKTVSNEPAN